MVFWWSRGVIGARWTQKSRYHDEKISLFHEKSGVYRFLKKNGNLEIFRGAFVARAAEDRRPVPQMSRENPYVFKFLRSS